MNSKEIKSIVIGYYKQLYVNKLDNLVWWDIFLKKIEKLSPWTLLLFVP